MQASIFCVFACWSTLLLLCPSGLLAQSALYETALEKYRSKDYSSALAAARQALEQDGSNASYRHIYGLILAALQRFTEAEENLNKAIALKPGEADFHYDLGYVLYQQRKYEQAVPVLERAVELDGDNLMARFLLGRSYVSSHRSLLIGNFSQLALEQFETIAKKNPRFPSVHLHIAKIHSNDGDKDKALQEYTTELEFYSENVLARLELGELLLKMGEPKKALQHLLVAGKEAPNMNLVQYALAKAYRENGQKVEAIQAARKCIELDPRSADAYYLLGQLYQETNQPELARQQMELFQKFKREEQ